MNAELRTLNHMSKNVDIGLFSVDTITVQQVYLAWDNAIYAHTPAVLHSTQGPKMLMTEEWPGLYRSSSVQ